MNKIRKRIVGKHVKDCYAVKAVKEGTWDTPWAYAKQTRFMNKNGAGRGSHMFVEIPCNFPQCTAILLISIDDVLRAAGESK